MAERVTIVGYGRFGELWAELLKPHAEIIIFDPAADAQSRAKANRFRVGSLEEALSASTIFYAVPISRFEEVIREHLPYYARFGSRALVVDLLSVKVHPKQVLDRVLPKEMRALLTHPMFGPDSVRMRGIEGQVIVVDRGSATAEELSRWTGLFASLGMVVREMSADEHDRLAAESQGVTHFVGRVLGDIGFHETPIDTLGAKKLSEIKDQVCHDSWQLFVDLQTYNPFTLGMRVRLGAAQSKIYNQLLPNRIYKDRLVVGIQGGKGSFNEQAARYYLGRSQVQEFELRYLHTTENVLRALHEGEVDRGQFAMHNSLGGIVHESVEAMARYNFKIVEEYAIKIAHAMMMRPDATFEEIDTVMTHPQVLRQCSKNLKMKYSKLTLTSGEGELVDHAKVASLLASKDLPKNVATMGSKVLAEFYGLSVIEENLQDLDENFTSFLWVERP